MKRVNLTSGTENTLIGYRAVKTATDSVVKD